MRRIAAAIVFMMTALYPTAAFAHPSIVPTLIAVNKVSSITFTISGDEAPTPLTGVDITMPATFAYQSATLATEWNSEYSSGVLHITGKEIDSSSKTLYITVTGTPSQRGTLKFPVTVIHKDGTRIEWNDTGVRRMPAVTVVEKVKVTSDKPTPTWMYFVPSVGIVLVISGVFFHLSKRR